MENKKLENNPDPPSQTPEVQGRHPLMETIRTKIDDTKAWIRNRMHPSTQTELEQKTGDALVYIAEQTIAEADSDGVRDIQEEQQIIETVGAAAEQTISGELAGQVGSPIEILESDGHNRELVDATGAIATEDPITAEKIAIELDRVQETMGKPEYAEREVYEAKLLQFKETSKSSAEVFTNVDLIGLSKQEKKAILDNPESWDPERRELQEGIYEKAIKEAGGLSERLLEKNPRPTIYVLRGNTASGKTRALSAGHKLFAGVLDESGEPTGAINPDPYKFELKEGEPGISTSQVHDEGSMIARRVERQLRDPHTSIVLDKRNETPGDIADILANAAETERGVRILDVDVPLENSLVGVLMRPRGGEDPNVPFDAIVQGFVGIRAHRAELIRDVETNNDATVDGYMLMAFDPSERKSVVVATLINGEVVPAQGKEELFESCYSAGEEELSAEAESIGNTIIDDAFIESYCATYFDDSEQARNYAVRAAAKLKEFEGLRLRDAIDIMADVKGARERADYQHDARRILLATSRTANGIIDTSASVTKADVMEDISGDEAAKTTVNNFTKSIDALFDERGREFSSPEDLRRFVESVAKQINTGLIQEDAPLIRGGADSTKYPYTKIADLPAKMEQFYEELYTMLGNPESDPVEVAAFAEYRINAVDHFFADGCGKTSKAISIFILMRSGLPLPDYEGGSSEYYKHVPKSIAGLDPDADKAAWQNFLTYYKSMIKAGKGAKL